MRAKVCRFYDYEGSKGWHVAVYWNFDPEQFPQDYDLFLLPAEWRKMSGLRSPKKGETMNVRFRVFLESSSAHTEEKVDCEALARLSQVGGGAKGG